MTFVRRWVSSRCGEFPKREKYRYVGSEMVLETKFVCSRGSLATFLFIILESAVKWQPFSILLVLVFSEIAFQPAHDHMLKYCIVECTAWRSA